MPCPSHLPSLDHSNYTWRRVHVMKLLIMQFSPTSRHFISLRSKYSLLCTKKLVSNSRFSFPLP
jgi:hypothetical protein